MPSKIYHSNWYPNWGYTTKTSVTMIAVATEVVMTLRAMVSLWNKTPKAKPKVPIKNVRIIWLWIAAKMSSSIHICQTINSIAVKTDWIIVWEMLYNRRIIFFLLFGSG